MSIEVKADEIFKEIGFGLVKVYVKDGKLCNIPKQVVERESKLGFTIHFCINETITLTS